MSDFYEMIREYIKGNLLNTVILIIMAISFNKKLNLILTSEAVNVSKITELEHDVKKLQALQTATALKVAAHIGDAYVREEE